MSISPQIEKLIVKFLNRTISENEEQQLSNWLNTPYNEEEFAEYVKTHYVITNKTIKSSILKQSKNRLILTEVEKNTTTLSATKEAKVKKLSVSTLLKYVAAIIIIAIVPTYYVLNQNNMDLKVASTIETKITPGSNKAILTLNNGEEINLNTTVPYKSKNANTNNGTLVYHLAKTNTETTEYNYLTTPRGGQYVLQLPDGTKIWINSESKLKYPTRFVSGKTREIELLYGEAYFDVTSSRKNNDAAFKVISPTQQIEVLGTEFNVKSYQNDNKVYTTLIEGKVNVTTSITTKTLTPNQQFLFNKNTNTFHVNHVDVKPEILWKDGVFSFKGKTLKDIIATISRWYDVDIILKNKNLENLKFSGAINKNKNIEDILELIKFQTDIDYQINNKTITLK